MPFMLSRLRLRSSLVKFSCLSLFALFVSVPGARADAPAIVVDAQQTIASGYHGPQGFAGNNTNNGAIFIADTNKNQLIILYNGVSYPFSPPGFTLVGPQAVAIDVLGNVFVADTPSNQGTSYGRIIELPAAGGNWDGTAHVVYAGSVLSNPISLAVDNSGTLFIGDYPLASGNGAIYSLPVGAAAPTPLTLTGTPATLTPAGLVRDAANNLYFTDGGSADGTNLGGVYIVPAAGGTAAPVNTQSFQLNQPSGITLDTAGNLYIATTIGSAATGQQVLVVPAASPTNPYILPNTGINSASALTFDAKGNLDVLSFVDGGIYQITFGSSINLGYSSPSAPGIQLLINFEFNAPATLGGFAVVTGGDASTEVTQVFGGSCVNGAHATAVDGGAVTPADPYTCNESYEGTPKYPGFRNSAIQIKGAGTTLLASVPVYQWSVGGVQVTYPFTATATAGGLQVPQAVAISGLDKMVYVADTAAGLVYSTSGLAGTTLTPVSTGSITLVAPSALAVDGAGNLYIADFGGTNPGQLVEVPISGTPTVVNTGSLLQHPIALTVDTLGNLYLGDAGPGGTDAGSGNPGFLVKIPAGGAAAKLNTPMPIVFPQSLVTNPYTGFLFVGDGGDPSLTGEVDVLTADGTEGGPFPVAGITDPTGLAFDPAGNLYILDGVSNSITVDPIYLSNAPAYTYNLNLNNTALNSASAMALSAGGQSLVISNVGNGANNSLFYVNGNAAGLAFGTVPDGTQSSTMTATVANIGNFAMTLGTPFFASTTTNAAFSLLNSSTCTNGSALGSGSTCTVNYQFTPSSAGPTSQQFTFPSNAYNNSVPVLTLQGTGGAGGSVAKHKHPKK